MTRGLVGFLRQVVGWFKHHWIYLLSLAILAGSGYSLVQAAAPATDHEDCWRIVSDCRILTDAIAQTEVTKFEPSYVLAQTDYQHFVTYKIDFQGQLKSSTDTNQFIAQLAETLADSRGWVRAGYIFKRVQIASHADFTLVLIQAQLLDDIPGCSSQWSCRAGGNVYINENRWNGATTAWNNAGGNLRDYRHMVINHEVGHWLGHEHYHCSDSPNQLAPVMQQQSIDLEGCQFNPWPLSFEITGI